MNRIIQDMISLSMHFEISDTCRRREKITSKKYRLTVCERFRSIIIRHKAPEGYTA